MISALPATAVADATDDYPIPHRMIVTTCTAEQILAAARDFTPIYYERYMIDKHNKSPEVQQAPSTVRTTSIRSALPIAKPTPNKWSPTCRPHDCGVANWAKIFFNNKGVTAKETDHCADYPPADLSVWDWSPAR